MLARWHMLPPSTGRTVRAVLFDVFGTATAFIARPL
jgi:hypothetical protein